MALEIRNKIHAIGAMHVAATTASWTCQNGFTAVFTNAVADYITNLTRPIIGGAIAAGNEGGVVLACCRWANGGGGAGSGVGVTTRRPVSVPPMSQVEFLTWDAQANAPIDNVDVDIAIIRVGN